MSAVPAVAVIGLALRVPGAASAAQLWRNLHDGIDSISRPSAEEMLAQGGDIARVNAPNRLNAAGRLSGFEFFDAEFFEMTPREAAILDPQHRLMLELGHEALEDAGYDPFRTDERIGVFAGVGQCGYLLHNIARNRELAEAVGPDAVMIGNDKGFACTRLSYKLGLRGPSICIDTACSTSLVAIHLACRSLLTFECDIAIAGGVRVLVPHWDGDPYDQGGIHSPYGTCRAFDRDANGTVPGSGGALVVLRRLDEATRHKDSVRAVVRASAINNDGASKVSYSAPNVDGQRSVIAQTWALAGIESSSIGYIEAHGTGTPLGDSIELTALGEARGAKHATPSPIPVGSIKTNIGHLDVAAGVIGFVKAVLCLQQRRIPPTLHFSNPNPCLSPMGFLVNAAPISWSTQGTPRLAGVSAFGIGGTNAHALLEEAPATQKRTSARRWHVLVLSARTSSALASQRRNLAAHLAENPAEDLAAVAHTVQVGRRQLPVRYACAVGSLADAQKALSTFDGEQTSSRDRFSQELLRPVVWVLPAGRYSSQGFSELLACEPGVSDEFNRCMEVLRRTAPEVEAQISADLSNRNFEAADSQLLLQFCIQYSVTRKLLRWVPRTEFIVSCGTGELVAACLAELLPLRAAMLSLTGRGDRREIEVALDESAAVRQERPGGSSAGVADTRNLRVISGLLGRQLTARDLAHPDFLREAVAGRTLPVLKQPGWSPGEEPILISSGSLDEQKAWCASSAMKSAIHIALAGPHRADMSRSIANALAELFVAGADIDWKEYHGGDAPGRVALPPYPFERMRHWVEPSSSWREEEPLARITREKESHGAGHLASTQAVLDVWRDSFGIDNLSFDSDFFEAGGDSLLATRLLSRVRDRFGVEISAAELFDASTPSSMTELVRRRQALLRGEAQM